MNVGTIAKWLNLPPEKQTALEKAWEVVTFYRRCSIVPNT